MSSIIELENEIMSLVMRARDFKKTSNTMSTIVTDMAKYSEELQQPDIQHEKLLFIISFWRYALNYIAMNFKPEIARDADALDRRLIQLGLTLGTPYFNQLRK